MKPEFIGIIIVALAWGCYPLLVRSANAGGALGTFAMMSAGWLVIATATVWQKAAWVALDRVQLSKLTGAGVLMGIGLLAFNQVAARRRMDASISIPIMDTAMLIVTVLAAVLFFAEPFSLKKGLGIALLLAGIAVLHQQ